MKEFNCTGMLKEVALHTYVASSHHRSYMARANRLNWLRTKSYVYLQLNVTTGSYITKQSILQYVTDRITTKLRNVTT